MIEWIFLFAMGIAAGIYVYLSWSGISVLGLTVSGGIGGVVSYVTTMYSDLIYWLREGMSFGNVWATLFLIGYVTFIFVLIGNVVITATDNKNGITAIQ